MNRYLLLTLIIGTVAIVNATLPEERVCRSAYFAYGLTMPTCPSGTLRQTARLQVQGVRRGAKARVHLTPVVHYTTQDADEEKLLEIPQIAEVGYALVAGDGKVTALPVGKRLGDGAAELAIPEVPDGDYKLRASYRTRIGVGTLDADVPLYTPARVHVITDRPLYEPGNVVRFRAVVLRARDLAPLDGRPGRWIVKDPNGDVLLEERAPATDWGVVAGSFPLDRLAQTGPWKIAWSSAAATDEVSFDVQPFKLPRFRVDAIPDRSFYRPGDKPLVRGSVVYSSGAPVAKANVEIAWEVAGAWPPPLEWEEQLLPRTAVTGADGRFELDLPQIPDDLQGKVTLTGHVAAIDAAGDRVQGTVTVLLSKDGIEVAAVTELGDGLVGGFNNRMYVRVSTPDGQVVRNAKLRVVRAWQPDDPGLDSETDEDGVASMQVDPGAPVNIVIPPVPYRPAKRAPLVSRGDVEELIGDEGASLADQIEIDRWLAPLAVCAKWVGASSGDEAEASAALIGMRVDRGGAIVTVGASRSPLGECVASFVRGRRLPPGPERMYTVGFELEEPDLPKLETEVVTALEEPEELGNRVDNLARSARDCLPDVEGMLPRALMWRVRAGAKQIELGPWIDDPSGGDARLALACVQRHFGGRIALGAKAEADALGLIKFRVTPPERETEDRPQATTMLGYELSVTASIAGAPSTVLRIAPGNVPNVRMRVSPILAKVGDTITAELIRGPEFKGDLPEELVLDHLKGTQKAKLDADRKAVFQIEPGTQGWVAITGAGLRSLVYVKSAADLAVTVEPKQPRYKPGDQAQLHVRTQIAGAGAQAAVGLFGVDESLGQLAALPGADSMARVQAKVTTTSPAFGVLDGQALALGGIRGTNAAAATVLRVSSIPSAPELDAEVSTTASTRFDPVEELTDNFYTVLAELHLQARRWEATAPKTDKMRPATMVALWNKALAVCAQRKERVVDAYGRKLRLSLLPPDLLALTDPHAVIVVGTRLPEDVESWTKYIEENKP